MKQKLHVYEYAKPLHVLLGKKLSKAVVEAPSTQEKLHSDKEVLHVRKHYASKITTLFSYKTLKMGFH